MKNKFDKRYEIRLAKYEDIESIMKFINDYWREGHILARDRTLFEYEYVDGKIVNFVLAIERNTGLIEGIFGFLNCSQTTNLSKKDIWGSMWKVVDNHNNTPFLGVELAKRVFDLTGCRTHIGNGANPNTTIPLRKRLFGDEVAKMKHYYYLNREIDNFKIASITNMVVPQYSNSEVKLVKFRNMEDLKERFDVESVEAIPFKDNWYINKRYFQHPYYKYKVYGLQNEFGEIKAIMMTRSIECNGSKVLRIVDFIGNQELFAGLGKTFEKLVKQYNYEYVDFYTFGFNKQYIYDAGFKLRDEDDPNIIPNYFQPFLLENVDNWVHYKLDGTLFFKADGDQDRPNL